MLRTVQSEKDSMIRTTFFSEVQFYKGNIHCHSTRSDGRMEPAQLVEEYKKRGYQFMLLTEHNIYTHFTEFDTEDFLLLPGMEINPPPDIHEVRDYHFLVIPGTKEHRSTATLAPYQHDQRLTLQPFRSYEDLQALIDDAYYRGNMVIINHPYWSKIEYDEILPLRHLCALEAYNYCSCVLENVGEALSCWDAVLRHGMRLWGTAVDDTHNFYPIDSGGNDAFGGYIMVKARSLSQDDLMDAFAAGSFYGSSGPEIKDFYVEDNMVHFKCSPVSRIFLNGHQRQIRVKWAEPGEELTELVCPLYGETKWTEKEKYIRAECYDAQGRKAFTNPIWLD